MSMRGSSTWQPIMMDRCCELELDCVESRMVRAFFRGVVFSPSSSRVSDFRGVRTAGRNAGRTGTFNPPDAVGDCPKPLARRRVGTLGVVSTGTGMFSDCGLMLVPHRQ
jgi:hypothetical protein